MHSSRTYVAPIAHSSTGDVVSTNGTEVLCSRAWILMYVTRGARVEFSPVVFVAALWSRVGSVQPLRTDLGQNTCLDEQQTVRIVGDLDLQAIVCRLTVTPRVGRDLWNLRNLNILQVNINGIKRKPEELKLLIHDTHVDIMTIQEIKLTHKANIPKLHNFTTMHADGLHKAGGGSLHSLDTILHSLQ